MVLARRSPRAALQPGDVEPASQWAIRERNFFVERILPAGVVRKLSAEEMDHYRAVQAFPAARAGVAEFPRQIVAAGPFLAGLAERVPKQLGAKQVLVTYPMRDPAFPAGEVIPRMRAAFSDLELVELPQARHYFLEDASEEVAAAIRVRFGGGRGPK
jgi:haloalkane dehalogenase